MTTRRRRNENSSGRTKNKSNESNQNEKSSFVSSNAKTGSTNRPDSLGSNSDDNNIGNPLNPLVVDCVTAVLVFLCYGKARNWEYVWDDEIIHKHEPAITQRTPYDLWFRPMEKEIHYWPVTYTSFWIEYHLSGQEFRPDLSHLVNMVLHGGNACLLHRILLRILLPSQQLCHYPALVAWCTWIFAVHPVHVESVAWIIERKDVLSGFFYFLSILLHPNTNPKLDGDNAVVEVHNSRNKRNIGMDQWYRSRMRFLSSMGCYVLALWSKSIVVSLPMTLLLIPWIRTGRLTLIQIYRTIPFFVVGMGLTGYDVMLAREREPVQFGYSIVQRLGLVARNLCLYMQKLIWPYPLVMIYPKWSMPMNIITILLHMTMVATVGIGCLWVLARKHPSSSSSSSSSSTTLYQRGPLAALLFFGWTLFPVLGLLDYGYMNYSFVADRYQYLASIGPTVLIVMAGLGSFPNRNIRNIVGCTGLTIFVFMTRQQVDHYQNNETFFKHVIQHNPNASIGYLIVGNEHLRQNRLNEAISMYEQALAVEPEKEKDILMNYGIALNELERNQESVAILERYLGREIDTSDVKIWNALGNAHSGLKHYDLAIRYFQRALDLDPEHVSSWYNLGNEYLRSGRIEQSIAAYERTIQLDPRHFKACINMASALMALQQNQRAVYVLERAWEWHPQNSLVVQKLQEARMLLHNP